MKFAKLILAASALALAAGGAYAADSNKQAKASDPEPGFNNMDKNNDGKLTRAEAAKDKSLLGKWKQADRDNDGQLSRSEYLLVKGKKDLNTAKEKVSEEAREVKERVSRDNKSDSSSSAGGTAKSK
jgi:hypothetical protein